MILKQTMDNPEISIRLSKYSDLGEIQRMFVETISAICKDDYSKEQIKFGLLPSKTLNVGQIS